ncbi:endo-1,4-beta-xylanase [Marinimicrobium sp. ABcell2]|uniref:endo-1,4-beta-xylanase n=1 Tax=Marinimicrobium sp. ABcell2 TaxID=3069751 RepID=UPI0027B58897|nr:endo-1,4-beta-xylanase [Marinimicrobium sp. ABcell2]MDQ2077178.1 endo-1,4-beta-xylanase [Marinimicrobium sp. ABcell2]
MKHLAKFVSSAALGLSLAVGASAQEVTPLAEGHDKFLGGIFATNQVEGFTQYFNQVTPENAGKWGAVTNQNSRPAEYQDSWFEGGWHGGLDNAFNLAKDNDFVFRMHVLIWGNQQPGWIRDLPQEEQLEAIREWFGVLRDRYNDDRGGFDYIEVVNEPVNDPPDGEDGDSDGGHYADALASAVQDGTGGEWDWAIAAYEMAREYFPRTPDGGNKLMLNEYNVISVGSVRSRYLELAELLKERDLLDAIGAQAHAFSTGGSSASIRAAIDEVAAVGVPVYITEMDIDGPTDQEQLLEYSRVFPIFWEHEAVAGVTLWGFRPGLWRDSANLVRTDGSERPAMKWLRCYLQCDTVAVIEDQVFELGDNARAGANIGRVVGHSPNGNISSWEITGGDDASLFTINEDGRLALASNATLDHSIATSHDISVVAHDSEGSSEPVTVRLKVRDEGGPADSGGNGGSDYTPPVKSTGGGASSLLLLMLTMLGGAGLMSRRTR